jgi:hypothetical protein
MKKVKVPFKAVCINDKNRPDGIPTSKWITKGEIYTVIEVSVMRIQNDMVGFKLEEKNIDDCIPYQYFDAARFLPLDFHTRLWAELELERILQDAIEEEEHAYLNN